MCGNLRVSPISSRLKPPSETTGVALPSLADRRISRCNVAPGLAAASYGIALRYIRGRSHPRARALLCFTTSKGLRSRYNSALRGSRAEYVAAYGATLPVVSRSSLLGTAQLKCTLKYRAPGEHP